MYTIYIVNHTIYHLHQFNVQNYTRVIPPYLILTCAYRLTTPIDRSQGQSKRIVGTERGSLWLHSRRGDTHH